MKTLRAVVTGAVMLAATLAVAGGRTSPGNPQESDHQELRPQYVTVSGTVTVRAKGVLVDPQSINYNFTPAFAMSAGPLRRMSEGTYVLEVSTVPAEESFDLTISASYNDGITRPDGVVERQGRTYTGVALIRIPYGRDYSFGNQLLDLQ